jgi:hypothetical protein
VPKVLPQENLKIEGTEISYDFNDKINLSCKSGEGRPYPHLSWFINDNMVRLEPIQKKSMKNCIKIRSKQLLNQKEFK